MSEENTKPEQNVENSTKEKTKSNMKLRQKYKNRVGYLVYGTKDHILTYPFKLIYNCFKSLYYYLKFL